MSETTMTRPELTWDQQNVLKAISPKGTPIVPENRMEARSFRALQRLGFIEWCGLDQWRRTPVGQSWVEACSDHRGQP